MRREGSWGQRAFAVAPKPVFVFFYLCICILFVMLGNNECIHVNFRIREKVQIFVLMLCWWLVFFSRKDWRRSTNGASRREFEFKEKDEGNIVIRINSINQALAKSGLDASPTKWNKHKGNNILWLRKWKKVTQEGWGRVGNERVLFWREVHYEHWTMMVLTFDNGARVSTAKD